MGSPAARLGRYELVARIAAGGMGEIFLARREGAAGFEKLFVIKRILPHLAGDGRFRRMLIDEARIAANMSHANICTVYELDEHSNELYIVMENLEGVTLLTLLRRFARARRRLDFGFVAGVVEQAAEGLHYAHELHDRAGAALGIIHRDVTPSNVFVTDGGVIKLLDFGIAKVKAAAGNTDVGAVKGKYAYMAPEQLRGAEIDRRVDVFALGVVTYELLTCQRLFQRENDFLTFQAVMELPLPDLRAQRSDVPDGLAEVLARALERDPAQRYATVRQFATALSEVLTGVKRPWSQAEIGDLVRTTFADEITRQNEEIASAIQRGGRDSVRGMPLITRDAPDDVDPDDREVELAIVVDGPGPEPAASATVTEASAGEAAHDAAHAAAHRADDDAQDMTPSERPLRAVPLASGPMQVHPAAPAPPRGPLAPVLAIVGAAAIALAVGLVWIGSPAPAEPTPAGPVAPPRRSPAEPYGAALDARRDELDRCARAHAGALPAGARAQLIIAGTGQVTAVAFTPRELAALPIAACVRDVLGATRFPGGDARQLVVGLRTAER